MNGLIEAYEADYLKLAHLSARLAVEPYDGLRHSVRRQKAKVRGLIELALHSGVDLPTIELQATQRTPQESIASQNPVVENGSAATASLDASFQVIIRFTNGSDLGHALALIPVIPAQGEHLSFDSMTVTVIQVCHLVLKGSCALIDVVISKESISALVNASRSKPYGFISDFIREPLKGYPLAPSLPAR